MSDVSEPVRDVERCTPLSGVMLEKTPDHVYCRFDQPREVFSSAVLAGGWQTADQFLNLKVDANCVEVAQTPQQTLLDYCSTQGWSGRTVGMMTAASMNSLRFGVVRVEQVELLLVLTCGLTNARRAGDAADSLASYTPARQLGTVNIAVVANSRFSAAALAELMIMVTEAKCAAFQQANIVSPVSGLIATGTGTDSVALFNGLKNDADEVQYCGKHTLLGEVFAQTLIELLTDSFF